MIKILHLTKTINELDNRWRLLLIFAFILILVAVSTSFYYFQKEQKAIFLEKSISTLKAQAMKAQYRGDLDKADNLYNAALVEAADSHCPMKVIEFLSRLVQVKIQNHKLGQTDSLVQQAMQLALAIKDTDAADSNLDVWMDDMANAFYKRGEHSTREEIKLYCLKHYMDIKLPIENCFDPLLIGRADQLICYLNNHQQESEFIHYQEQVFNYIQRTKPNDASIMSNAYLDLAKTKLCAHKFPDAESAFKQCFLLRKISTDNPGDQVELYLHLAQVREAEGHLHEARKYYQKAFDLQKQCGWLVGTARYANTLAFAEQRLGNLTKASKLYLESLDYLNNCTKAQLKITPLIMRDCGQVFAAEHLAQIASKQGNIALAKVLLANTKKIRDRNPYWSTVKDLDRIYIATGIFPSPQGEIIPTRFSLQEINAN
jgi:tetratricopeptide (TPR) repeat protein